MGEIGEIRFSAGPNLVSVSDIALPRSQRSGNPFRHLAILLYKRANVTSPARRTGRAGAKFISLPDPVCVGLLLGACAPPPLFVYGPTAVAPASAAQPSGLVSPTPAAPTAAASASPQATATVSGTLAAHQWHFGADLNAETGAHATTYILRIPLDKPEVMDTALKVLVDWASCATLDPAQMDRERGVIQDEYACANRMRKAVSTIS